MLQKFGGVLVNAERFVAAYRHYCWKVDTLDDLKLAPFHLLATTTESGMAQAIRRLF